MSNTIHGITFNGQELHGIVATPENIKFIRDSQAKKREESLKSIKNFTTLIEPLKVNQPKVKTKISHSARRARRVALSIAADPRNRGTSRSK